MNTGHTRFQDALLLLRDCAPHLDDADLDRHERRARNALIRLCREIGQAKKPPARRRYHTVKPE